MDQNLHSHECDCHLTVAPIALEIINSGHTTIGAVFTFLAFINYREGVEHIIGMLAEIVKFIQIDFLLIFKVNFSLPVIPSATSPSPEFGAFFKYLDGAPPVIESVM